MAPVKIDDNIAAKVAYLKCTGRSQLDISRELRIGEATISRMLAQGGEAHAYIKPPEFDWSRASETVKAELRAMEGSKALSKKLTERLIRTPRIATDLSATVISRKGTSGATQPHEFYESAVRAVWERLAPAQTIGISWGNSLHMLLQAARRIRISSPFDGKHQPLVVPLCGESLGDMRPSALSSSALARAFGEILTDRAESEYLSLAMIPVFLPGPTAFGDVEREAVREFLRYSPAYTRIFGGGQESGTPPLAEQLDVVITSISHENRPFGFEGNTEEMWRTLKLGELAKMVFGDLAGVPLANPGIADKELEPFVKCWTCLEKRHLQLCAKKASRDSQNSAGVIVVGSGSDRAACIVEAVRNGLVNHLVVDEDLGTALIERLDRAAEMKT